MRIALAQVDCVLGDLDANLESAAKVVAGAVADGADLVVFPELSLTGYSMADGEPDVAMEAGDPRLMELAACAGDAAVAVGFVEAVRGVQTYNSFGYFEGGRRLHVHRKLYLPTYDIFEERKHFSPGVSMRAFDTRAGRVAVLICNDAWQPVLAFVSVQDGAKVLLVPTASAQSRFPERYDTETYWRDITRFYARMFQSFVVYVNRVGSEGQLRFWGGSHVLDPWGATVCEAPLFEAATVMCDVDLDAVRRRRREVPLVREARLALLSREFGRLADEGGDL